jgi:glyoxylase-like metal-dependent hydrolase (beta-lactamase superfamily II)
MIFRQLFHSESSTYTYLLADEISAASILIDPVRDQLEDYLLLLDQLGLKLVITLDTHTHADHITAAGELRERTGCRSMLGEESCSDCASATFKNGDKITFGNHHLTALYTPGHTVDSYSFHLQLHNKALLFTGDTLLIRGTGRTDFQNGNANDQYHSIFETLFQYPDDTLVYPGHDYKGWTTSTVGEEKLHNPRLQINSCAEYVAQMDNLKLPDPKLMDIAVPANQACGKSDFVA